MCYQNGLWRFIQIKFAHLVQFIECLEFGFWRNKLVLQIEDCNAETVLDGTMYQ